MARRLAHLTLDNLSDLPVACQSCVFWELDPVRRERAVNAGEAAREKESWISQVLLEWGSCGRVAYVDGDPAGYVMYAPPAFVPGNRIFPTAPASEDSVLLMTAMVHPEYADAGLGRVLVQAVAKDLLKRGGIRAIEAFADTRPHATGYGGCLLPADFLLRVGFKTHRQHPRHPRLRLELRSVLTWREEVEAALEKLVGGLRPVRPAAEHVPRQLVGPRPPVRRGTR
jgi:GNAT superfamily N-acetyltransferase